MQTQFDTDRRHRGAGSHGNIQQTETCFCQAMDWLDLMIRTWVDTSLPPLLCLPPLQACIPETVSSTQSNNRLYTQTMARARKTHDAGESPNPVPSVSTPMSSSSNVPSWTCRDTWIQKQAEKKNWYTNTCTLTSLKKTTTKQNKGTGPVKISTQVKEEALTPGVLTVPQLTELDRGGRHSWNGAHRMEFSVQTRMRRCEAEERREEAAERLLGMERQEDRNGAWGGVRSRLGSAFSLSHVCVVYGSEETESGLELQLTSGGPPQSSASSSSGILVCVYFHTLPNFMSVCRDITRGKVEETVEMSARTHTRTHTHTYRTTGGPVHADVHAQRDTDTWRCKHTLEHTLEHTAAWFKSYRVICGCGEVWVWLVMSVHGYDYSCLRSLVKFVPCVWPGSFSHISPPCTSDGLQVWPWPLPQTRGQVTVPPRPQQGSTTRGQGWYMSLSLLSPWWLLLWWAKVLAEGRG